MDRYVIYLRKSRADVELEVLGEGETLARHEKTLLELGKKLKLNIEAIYREIVSGETIASRPEMQKLLSEVGVGYWTGVLVMEVERLARGDTADQGLVANAFKYSATKIVTPVKIYDPQNEFDEEYFEFGLYMSRREYKTINRRLQGGRIDAAKEGKFVGSQPPYGYNRVKIYPGKGYTLEPHPTQADVIRLIFDLYTKGELQDDGTYVRFGITMIASKLNEMGIDPPKGNAWVAETIRDILINPVYIGKIRWNWRPTKKLLVDGKFVTIRPRNDDMILVDGLHPAIVGIDTFNTAQLILGSNAISPVNADRTIKNPMAGLIICGICGRTMVRKIIRNGPDTIMCAAGHCNNISAALTYVEDALISSLQSLLANYKITLKKGGNPAANSKLLVLSKQVDSLDQELAELLKQQNAIYDMLEKGVYTTDIFLERSSFIADRIQSVKSGRDKASSDHQAELSKSKNYAEAIPKLEHLLAVYNILPDAKSKNDMLKEVIEKAVYIKYKSGHYKGVDPRDFELTIYPRII